MAIVFVAVLFFADSVSYNLEQMLHFGHYFEIIAIGIMMVVLSTKPADNVRANYRKNKYKGAV